MGQLNPNPPIPLLLIHIFIFSQKQLRIFFFWRFMGILRLIVCLSSTSTDFWEYFSNKRLIWCFSILQIQTVLASIIVPLNQCIKTIIGCDHAHSKIPFTGSRF
jgi:hypothetical protein